MAEEGVLVAALGVKRYMHGGVHELARQHAAQNMPMCMDVCACMYSLAHMYGRNGWEGV